MGVNTYFIERTSKDIRNLKDAFPKTGREFQGKGFLALFDDKGIVGVRYRNKVVKLKQQFLYYNGTPSNAYVFNPTGKDAKPISGSNPQVSVIKGNVISEFRQVNDWVSQSIRVYRDSPFIEFD